MNRSRILKALRAAGFTGKTWDEALAFIKDQGLELTADGAEKAMTEAEVKTAWDTKSVIKLEAELVAEVEDETETEAEESKEDDATEVHTVKKSASQTLREVRTATAKAATNRIQSNAVPGIMDSKRTEGRKSYQMKVKATQGLPFGHPKKAVYEDVDEAEFAGAFLRLAIGNAKGFSYPQRENDLAIVGKASSEANNTSAGVLVAPQYFPQVVWLTEFYGVARKIANVQRFSGTDEWRRPRKTGLLTMAWTAEGATISPSDNTYDLITLVPRKLAGLMLFSTELFNDAAVNIADQFTQSVAEGWAKAEDDAYFNGDGSVTYGNMTGLANGLPSGAYIAMGANYAAVSLAALTNLPGSVQNIQPASNVCYASSRQAYYQTAARLMNAGGGNKNFDLKTFPLASPGSMGQNAEFNGIPWYFAQVMDAVGTTSGTPEIYYGDFGAATMLGVHTDLRIMTSTDRYMDTDQIAMRATARGAVNIHGDGRGSTVGPIAALKVT